MSGMGVPMYDYQIKTGERHTSGKCWHCNVRYVWSGKPLLKDSHCPSCGQKLRMTNYQFKGKTIVKRPLEKLEEKIEMRRD